MQQIIKDNLIIILFT